MATGSSTSDDVIIPLSEEEQAAALWVFIHLKLPRFTSESALQVVRRLAPYMGESPKSLAKRLRRELGARGLTIKHAAALNATARLLGQESWHSIPAASPALKLLILGRPDNAQPVSDWRELGAILCSIADEWLGERDSRLFQVRFGPNYMMMNAMVARPGSGKDEPPESWPLLVVNPVEMSDTWLEGAGTALERLRRYLEESGRAVLDGFEVLHLCEANRKVPVFTWPQGKANDVCNSELILLRADHEWDAGYEIARGDEMTCWYQFELAIRDHRGRDIAINEEDGAWRVGDGRYVWQLSTLRPTEIVPGLTHSELGPRHSPRLFRRYQIAKRIYQGSLIHHEQTKRLEYLGTAPETYRVNLHPLLLAMNKLGLTWEAYCSEIGQVTPMEPRLPTGFVLALLKRLDLEDPNIVFARPTRSELARVDDDQLLRALLPRVDHVLYRLRRGVPDEMKSAVKDAIEEFATSIRLRTLQSGGQLVDPKDPLPYLVYASDGEELRLKLEEQGLVMYAGVIPHLFSTKGVIEESENMWPFAIGNSLFLDIDLADDSERETGGQR